jgi:hypothetical protein
MSDTFFDGAGASFGGAGGTASDARTLRQRCDAAIDGLRKNYAGDVTVQYYIREKKVICLRVEAEPSYRGEAFRCALDVDFGMSTGVLKAKTSVSGKGESVEAAATSGQTFRDGVAEDKWDLSVREDGSETLRLSGGSVWNSESGAYRASADAHDGEKSYAVSAEGTLKIGKADFELSLDKISDTDWAGGTHVFAAGVKYESGVEVPEPSGEKNLFKLTSDEFLALAASSAGKAAPLYGALTGGLGSGSQLP